jgi:hypothetical protein
MEQLTIKELAPYLPYDLNTIFTLSNVINTHKDEIRYKKLTAENVDFVLMFCKPILRPLSDLIKEIEVNGEKFRPAYRTQLYMNDKYLPLTINGRIVLENRIVTNTILYTDMQYLISLHFDVFGLIDRNLAINKTEI